MMDNASILHFSGFNELKASLELRVLFFCHIHNFKYYQSCSSKQKNYVKISNPLIQDELFDKISNTFNTTKIQIVLNLTEK